jgi:hypothetical protein
VPLPFERVAPLRRAKRKVDVYQVRPRAPGVCASCKRALCAAHR